MKQTGNLPCPEPAGFMPETGACAVPLNMFASQGFVVNRTSGQSDA
ncbi:hypothetical protein [Hoeflea sp.]|nr:hypothetical protein [Hoeflea sp.]